MKQTGMDNLKHSKSKEMILKFVKKEGSLSKCISWRVKPNLQWTMQK